MAGSVFVGNAGVVGGAIRVGAMMGDYKRVFPTTGLLITNSTFKDNTGLKSTEGVDLAIYWDGQESWSNEEATADGSTGGGCIWPKCSEEDSSVNVARAQAIESDDSNTQPHGDDASEQRGFHTSFYVEGTTAQNRTTPSR